MNHIGDEFRFEIGMGQSDAENAGLSVMERGHGVKRMCCRAHAESDSLCRFDGSGRRVSDRHRDSLICKETHQLHTAFFFRCERNANDQVFVTFNKRAVMGNGRLL